MKPELKINSKHLRAVLEHRNGVEIQLSRKFSTLLAGRKESNSICKIGIRIGSVEGNLERLRNSVAEELEALITQLWHFVIRE